MPLQTWEAQFLPSPSAASREIVYQVDVHPPHVLHPRTMGVAHEREACAAAGDDGPCGVFFSVPGTWGCGVATVRAVAPGRCWELDAEGGRTVELRGIWVQTDPPTWECDESLGSMSSVSLAYGVCPDPPIPIDVPEPPMDMMMTAGILASLLVAVVRRGAR